MGPAPLGIGAVCIDKLEMDKGGKFNLADVNKISVGCTYTGLKDAQVKFETKATKPQDFTGEVTYSMGLATCGVKFSPAGLPDVGVRFLSGPFFGSILAKEKLGAYTAHGFYKATPDIKCAATYQHGGKGNGNCTLGVSYKGLYKLKVAQDQSVSCSAKHSLAKGFTLLGGAKYSVAKGDLSYGIQLSIE